MHKIKRYIILNVALFLIAACSSTKEETGSSLFSSSDDSQESNTSDYTTESTSDSLDGTSLDEASEDVSIDDSSEDTNVDVEITFFNNSLVVENNFIYLDEDNCKNYTIDEFLHLNGTTSNESMFSFNCDSYVSTVSLYVKDNLPNKINIGLINKYGVRAYYDAVKEGNVYSYTYRDSFDVDHISIRVIEEVSISKIVLTLKNV